MTDRNDYWLNAVWGELPYRVPGTEGIVVPGGDSSQRSDSGTPAEFGQLRFNTDINRLEYYTPGAPNTWEPILSGNVPTIVVADDIDELPPGPQVEGTMAVVLDALDQDHQLMFVWKTPTPPEVPGTAPLWDWQLLATSEAFTSAVLYRNTVIIGSPFSTGPLGTTSAVIGKPFAKKFNPFVKEINVYIDEPFAAGVTIRIEEDGGNVLMPDILINPQLVGSYQIKIPGSTNEEDGIQDDYKLHKTSGGTGQILAFSNGIVGVGKAVVYIKVVTQGEETPDP